MTTVALFATWLGYLTALAALAALLAALAALFTHRDGWERASYRLILATTVGITVTTLPALSAYVASPASAPIYTQLFLAASCFTVAITCADWRSRDSDVLWKPKSRILYLGGYMGALALAIVLVWMG